MSTYVCDCGARYSHPDQILYCASNNHWAPKPKEKEVTNFVLDIQDFHKKFGLEYTGKPRFLDKDLHDFRSKFMQEELDEYLLARSEMNLEKQLDALVDLAYVVFGTAYLHGWGTKFQEAWNRVHAANMRKVRALNEDESKRGSVKYDVVKPPGWRPASLEDLVK